MNTYAPSPLQSCCIVMVISRNLVMFFFGFRIRMLMTWFLMWLMKICLVANSCSRASCACCRMVSWLVLPTIDVGYYEETLPSVKSRATITMIVGNV